MKKARKQTVSARPKRQQLYWIYKMIMNRKNFEYNLKDGITYYWWKIIHCRGCPCRPKGDRKTLKAPKKDIQFQKAKKRLLDELDIVKIVSSIRNLEQSQKVIFNENEL